MNAPFKPPAKVHSERSPGAVARDADRPVIVVDDDPAVARLMSHMIQECGCACVVTLSASRFHDLYETVDPDAVVLDLSMPGGDGIELLKYLAKQGSTALILIVSGCDRRVLESAMRLGLALGLRMGTPLTKPLLVSDLDRALRQREPLDGAGRHELCTRS